MEVRAQPPSGVEALERSIAAAADLLEITHQQGSQLQLRNGFIARADRYAPLPVGVQLLRRSNRSGLQLRLALAYFWLAGSRVDARPGTPPYTVRLPVRTVAAMVGLDGDSAADRRRVRENTRALMSDGLLHVETSGSELMVTLRSDLPKDANEDVVPYYRPGITAAGRDPQRDAYFTFPASFFTDGWLITLSPAGLVALLAFRYLSQTKTNKDQGLFISEHLRDDRFGFSERTYYAGTSELENRALAKSWSQHLHSSSTDAGIMVRRVFALRRGLFESHVMSQAGGAWPDPLVAKAPR